MQNPETELREALLRMAQSARAALVSGDFDQARVDIAGLATWAHEVATLNAVPVFAANTSTALLDVAAERRRQIEVEGWTPEHDDEHKAGGMRVAAACYAIWGLPSRIASELVSKLWPWTGWSQQWFKPKDTRHNLIRAGALILAEIERLDRAKG